MAAGTDLLERMRTTSRADRRIAFDENSIALALSDGTPLIDGNIGDVSVKRRLRREAATVGRA